MAGSPVISSLERRNPIACDLQEASSPIRVCFLIDALARAGTETQLLSLMRNLDRKRVKPYLALLDGRDELSRSLEPDDIPVLRLGIRTLRDKSIFRHALAFARFLRNERIQVLQTFFRDSSIFGVPVARLAGVPRLLRSRFNLGHNLTPLGRWVGRLLNFMVDGAVANCEACRQSFITAEWMPPEQVLVIPNGVELSRFSSIPDLDSAPDPTRTVVVGMTANLRPIKNPGLLLEAARLLVRHHPNLRFEFVGDGDQQPYRNLAASYGIDHLVTFHGMVADVPRFLSRIEIATLTSQSEGMPNSVIEYMAAGRAVVATEVGGTTELIQNEVNGLLIPPGDAERLAQAIGRLLEHPEFAARLGCTARAWIGTRHSHSARANAYATYYEDLIRHGRNDSSQVERRPSL